MANQKVISKHIKDINVRLYKSRGYGYEGHEMVTVTINGAKYNNSCCQNDGVSDSLVEWINDEIRDNPLAQKILEKIKLADESYTGANSIKEHGDGTYYVVNFGENQVMQVLRSLGVRLSPRKSSNRKDAYLVGYTVHNDGVEIEEDTTEA